MTNRKTLEYCQRSLAKQEKVDFNKVGIKGVRDFFEAKVYKLISKSITTYESMVHNNFFFFYRLNIQNSKNYHLRYIYLTLKY